MKSYFTTALLIVLALSQPDYTSGQQALHIQPDLQDAVVQTYSADKNEFPELQTKSVGIDFELVHSFMHTPDASIELTLFDDDVLTFDLSRTDSYGSDSASAIFKSADARPVYMISAWQDERYASNIIDYESGRFYTVRFNTKLETHLLSEISYEQMNVLSCGVSHTVRDMQLELMQRYGSEKNKNKLPVPRIPSELLTNTSATIDLMLVYTPLARQWADANEGGMGVSVSLMMGMTQFAMDISEIDLEFRLVALKEVDYDESNDPGITHIRRLTAGPHLNLGPEYEGYLEEVHVYRNEFGADIVAMLSFINDVGGMAWILDTTEGRPEFAFSVNRIQQLTRSFTLIHEIGHNFGSNHSRLQNLNPAPEDGGIFEYSAGWRWTGTNGTSYASVMAYNEGSIPSPVFSNPSITWGGAPTGTSETSSGPANNARSINEVKHIIAGYRSSLTGPPDFEISESDIAIELMPGQDITYPVVVENRGEGRLNWQLSLNSDEGQYESGSIYRKYNFTDEENFPAGSHLNLNGWTAIPGNGSYSFEISSANPSKGQSHLRLPPAPDAAWVGISSPQLESLTPDYEVSFDVYFPKNLIFSVYLEAERQSIRLFIRSNNIELVHTTVDFGTTRETVQYDFKRDTYSRINLAVLTERDEVILRYDDEEIVRFISDNNILSAERILFFSQSGTSEFTDAAIDIDNLVFREFDSNMEWIAPIDKRAGSLAANESKTIKLNIRTAELDLGTYGKELIFSSDDFQNPLFKVPVSLIVSDAPTSVTANPELPLSLALLQNYPNPFNPSTNISYELSNAAEISLDVYTVQGQHVASLANGMHNSGTHTISFDASRLASGIYVYRLRSGAETLSRTMLLIK